VRVPHAFRALGHRDFRLFWSGQLVSQTGRWMQALGQSWLVLELTGSPFKLGVVNSLQFAPLLLLAAPAGAVVDRLAKHRLLVATQVGLMVPALLLAALSQTGAVQYWQVAALAAVIGVTNAVDMPTRQAFVVELVGKDDLTSAVALNSAVFNAARMVGPAAGGLLIARYGVAVAFLLNGVSFLAVVAALLAMRRPGAAPRAGALPLGTAVLDGLRYAVASPVVSLVLSLVLVLSVTIVNHGVLVPLLARDVLGAEVEGFGLLMAALGVGALAGAAVVAQLPHRPPLAVLVGAAAVAATGVLALAAVHRFWLAAGLLCLVGTAQILCLSGCNTTLQLTTPDELRGRVMALYTMVFAGMSPVGAVFIGGVAEGLGTRAACLAGGGVGLAGVLALWTRWLLRHGAER
jgi:MFS family permease